MSVGLPLVGMIVTHLYVTRHAHFLWISVWVTTGQRHEPALWRADYRIAQKLIERRAYFSTRSKL